jgi:DNA-binding PadR family transcriptional regulator
VTGKRFFKHGELPLVILILLGQRPMNTYRLLSEIEGLFGDTYQPSTGTVYPAVYALVQEGLLTCAGTGAARTYRVTAQGRRAVAARRDDLARLELRTGAQLAPDDSLDAVLHGFLDRVRQLAPHLARSELEATLDRATKELLELSKKGEER